MKIEIELDESDELVRDLIQLKPSSRTWSQEIHSLLRSHRRLKSNMVEHVATFLSAHFGSADVASVVDGVLVIDEKRMYERLKKRNGY